MSMKILLYLSIGLSVGTVSGSLGIGGGVLLVPALIWLCQFEPGRAAGTSLPVLMIPVCLPAAWKAIGQERVDLEAACWIAAAFAVGALLGASLVPSLPEPLLRLCLGGLLIAIGWQFVIGFVGTSEGTPGGVSALLLAGTTMLGGLVLARGRVASAAAGTLLPAANGQSAADLDYHI
ncbi:MAG: sulfite exporter TauE/SafE family protein [Planctomycetia bacterium]|nr:sulfite exporter TauE/SafE family protein [Planctomycetia bacterium]